MSERLTVGAAVIQFFRHGSNVALALGIVALAAMLALRAPQPVLLAWLALGVAVFPLHEYVFHRFLLHAPASRFAWARGLQHRVHVDHHLDTRRADRFFTPLWALPLLVAGQFALYWLIGAPVAVAMALLLGNMVGFLYYEWVHYVAHVPYVPKTAWGREMKAYHLRHHHKNEHHWFGVTTPWLDTLFGTNPPLAEVTTSPTARRLHGED